MRRTVGITAILAASLLASAALSRDKAKVEEGSNVYNNYCFTCHGENLVSSGQTFDLRRLRPEDRKRFDTAVLNGKGQMPPWKGVLKDDEIDAIWAYIRATVGDK